MRECMLCFVAVGWLICLGFETEFQSISGRLVGDMEAVHCVSYPLLLFLVRIWCVFRLGGCAGRTIFACGSSYVLLCPCTPKWDRNDLSDSVDPIRLRT